MTSTKRIRYALLGVAFLCVLVLLCALSGALYSGAFTTTTPVTLKVGRAGLLMESGSEVKVRGVVVGTVESVDHRDGAVELALDLEPDTVSMIPANVTAELQPTTLFGRKFVSLVAPPGPSGQPVQAGAVIDSSSTTVDVNDVFGNLVSILDTLRPSKVNSTLSAVAEALQGRGTRLGDFLDKLNGYLGRFNNSVPVLARVLPKLETNLNTLSDVAPDLMTILRNGSTTAGTLVEKQAGLNAFLLSFTRLGNDGNKLFTDSEVPLVRALDVLRPTTKLLAEYSPMYPCFFAGLNQTRKYVEATIGGTKPGVNGIATFLPGQERYKSPRDLPITGAAADPYCYGMPRTDSDPPQPHYIFNDGSHPYQGGNNDDVTVGDPPLALMLFGPDGRNGR